MPRQRRSLEAETARLALALDQLVHDLRRDLVRLVGIDVAEQDQVAEQDRPVAAEAEQQPVPVEVLGPRPQEVGHVAAVEALALLDERLRPDHLLGRAEPRRDAEHLLVHRVLEPEVVHPGDPVARAEDHVDEVVSAVALAQPVGEGPLDRAAHPLQLLQGAVEVPGMDEDVEILGVPDDSGVAGERVGAADQERHPRLLQLGHRPAIELEGLG